jgi:hypothetical protein
MEGKMNNSPWRFVFPRFMRISAMDIMAIGIPLRFAWRLGWTNVDFYYTFSWLVLPRAIVSWWRWRRADKQLREYVKGPVKK